MEITLEKIELVKDRTGAVSYTHLPDQKGKVFWLFDFALKKEQ